MAQASSAQREPSMEEILASIRRIIEDNDAAGRKQALAAEPAAAPVQPDRTVIEVDTFRNELRAQAPEPRESRFAAPIEPIPAEPARDIFARKPTLADVHAQITAEAASLPSRWDEAPEEQPAPQRALDHDLAFSERPPYQRSPDDIRKAIENSRAAREDARALLGIPEPANTVHAPEVHLPKLHVHETRVEAPQHDQAEEERYVPFGEVRETQPENAVARPSLISDRVERQVAASFSELSEAFAARSRKTFDEMAEEMIAPLLRDWMENNLPTLVERLVREEIERVARGAQ